MVKEAYQQEHSCKIFGLAGIIIQAILCILSFSVLVVKRYLQFPKRPWKIWFMDVSKQAGSQVLAHFINTGVSIFLSTYKLSDACIWYFITNILNNTFEVLFVYVVLKSFEQHILRNRCSQYISGNYYKITIENHHLNEEVYKNNRINSESQAFIIINYVAWLIQFLIWICIVCTGKGIIFLFEILLFNPFNSIGQILLKWTQGNPTLELTVVIIIIPVILNGLSYWIQDNFIKKKRNEENDDDNIIQQIED